ncbi:hypothetical protein Desti_4012 [Desulfomonile tiedjei DSM 6799]|uniref:Uncharacterized protein n=1 Tax=Desulfomonile tiedjei (strain ATCC 49306 / DSM 6799 / DCB-1) TaxID=706587 RepID=I4CAR1_DESTA|nr:hypothetical protein Desti_4012 [Desulfomonile tiedjei DSM 6799]
MHVVNQHEEGFSTLSIIDEIAVVFRDLPKEIARCISRHKFITTFIIAYILTRVARQKYDFDPIRDFPIVAGWALDFGLWVAVSSIVYIFLGKLFPSKTSS